MRTLQELSSLEGRVAVITGGAGFIGRAMAAALCQAQCQVCLVDRPGASAAAAFDQLGAAFPGQIWSVAADLETEVARLELAASIASHYGRLDILINNAGFVGDSALQGWAVPFAEQSLATWRRAVEVNLSAPFHLTQLLEPLLSQSGKGSVINVGSIYGMVGPDMRLYEGTAMGNPAAYAASKGGLLQLTRWLSTSMAPRVRVNSITPGGLARGQSPSFVEKYVARTPLGRMGSEEDFVGATHFLASDLSAWVTGQNIVVDGGWTAW
jgi:NAD(P)-dependent dehydrogenase (short-subunit alcohol dehydrogenase family)